MQDKIKILIIDDEKHFTQEMHELLQNSGFESFEANTAKNGLQILSQGHIDLLILDVRLPDKSGLDVLQELKIKYPNLEIIIVSGHGDMDTVIKAMRLGAIDYLRKPFRYLDIQMSIERTKKFLQMQRQLKVMEEKNSLISKMLEEKIGRHFIGISQAVQGVIELANTAAQYPDTNVLITGESGTGKENIARIIHYSSERKDGYFCAVNSSAITETLMESEFFGHKKGSFTGAIADKKGFFEISNGGTLFLDEIADMPVNLQSKILRAIEEKVITRVGDNNQICTNFRIISATNHNIENSLEEKKFRLDLLHRLNTLHIHIPPLRERPEDIQPLLLHFIKSFAMKLNKPMMDISSDICELLEKYEFPGNVRELKNMTERAVILSRGHSLGINDFPVITKKTSTKKGEDVFNLKTLENELIRKAIKSCKCNQKAAADVLGITRDALIRKMKKYNINIRKNEE
ncbi:MAG: sigma-54-dependent transcriptional regulator [Ignavibacteriaceae bacterium]